MSAPTAQLGSTSKRFCQRGQQQYHARIVSHLTLLLLGTTNHNRIAIIFVDHAAAVSKALLLMSYQSNATVLSTTLKSEN